MNNRLFEELEVIINGELYNFEFGEHFKGFNEDMVSVVSEKIFPTSLGFSGTTNVGYYKILGNYVADNLSDYHVKYHVQRIINPTEHLTAIRKKLIKKFKDANFKNYKEQFKELRIIEENFGISETKPLDVDNDGNILIYGEKTTDLCEIANAIAHLKILI